jgi:hypothetical protein
VTDVKVERETASDYNIQVKYFFHDFQLCKVDKKLISGNKNPDRSLMAGKRKAVHLLR